MGVGETQKIIIAKYMNNIESLQAAKGELTDQILKIEGKDIELLESISGMDKLSSRVLLGVLELS